MNPPGTDKPTHDPNADGHLAAITGRDRGRDELAALEQVARADMAMRQHGGPARIDDLIAAGRPVFNEAAVRHAMTPDPEADLHHRIDAVADAIAGLLDELRAIAHAARYPVVDLGGGATYHPRGRVPVGGRMVPDDAVDVTAMRGASS